MKIDDARKAADDVRKMEVPSNEVLLIQALQEARAKVSGYEAEQNGLTRFKDSEPKQRATFKRTLDNLRAAASHCTTTTAKGLKDELKRLGPDQELIFLSGVGGDSFSDFDSKKSALELNEDKDFCSKISQSATLDELDKSFDEALRSAITESAKESEAVAVLQKAWAERIQKLNEAISKPASKALGLMPWLVAILCLFSLLILLTSKWLGEDVQMELVVSGQLIQFTTVVVLLVIVIILGLAERITDSTLSALLGGIGGYVLSQGVGRATAREVARQRAGNGGAPLPTVTPPPNPSPTPPSLPGK